MSYSLISRSELEQLYRDIGFQYLEKSKSLVRLHARQMEQSYYYRRYQRDFEILKVRWQDALDSSSLADFQVAQWGGELGYGLVAQRDYEPGEWIGEYTGLIRRARSSRSMNDPLGGYSTDYAWTYPVKKGIFPLEVDGRLWGNELRFVNHSFDANLEMEHCLLDRGWVLFMLTKRNIQKGEQLTIDYGEAYWTGGKRELILL